MDLKELLYDLSREKDPDKQHQLIRDYLIPSFDIHCIKSPDKHHFSLLSIYKCTPNIGEELARKMTGRNHKGMYEFGHSVIMDNGVDVGINIYSVWFTEHFEVL